MLETIRTDMEQLLEQEKNLHYVDVRADTLDEALADAASQLETRPMWQARISFRIQVVSIQANTVFIFRLKVDRPAVGAPLPSHQARIKILRDRLDLLCR